MAEIYLLLRSEVRQAAFPLQERISLRPAQDAVRANEYRAL